MSTLNLVRRVQRIVDLSPHFNNQGIASDPPPAGGGLDGFGTVFRAQTLPLAGTTVICDGVEFLFAGSGPRGDNLACEGQQLSLPPGPYTALHVLGMCDWRGFEEVLSLRYQDGACAPQVLGLSDGSCFRGRLFGEQEGLRGRLISQDSLVPHAALFGIPMPGAEYRMQEMALEAGIWHQVVLSASGRTLVGCVLPDNPAMHLFALTLEEERR